MNSPAASLSAIRYNDSAFRSGVIDARLGRDFSSIVPRARAAAYRAGRRAYFADPSIAAAIVPNAA